MKRLTCEMCGGTDLLKQDGVFVCQSCGCKYTVEEARKMMVEGVVQVEGTVKIDNTAQIENYRNLAFNAYNAGSTDEAYNYFMKVLEIDPADYQAIFYKGMCLGWKTTLATPRIQEAMNAYYQALEILPHNFEESSSQKVKVLFSVELVGLIGAWFELAQNRYYDVRLDDGFYSSNIDVFWDYLEVAEKSLSFLEDVVPNILGSTLLDAKKRVGDLYCDCCQARCENVVKWLDYSKQKATFPGSSAASKKPYLDRYDNMVFEIRKDIPDFRRVTQSGTIDRMDPPTSIGRHNTLIHRQNEQLCLEIDRAIDERVYKYKAEQAEREKSEKEKARAEAEKRYWEENPGEKVAYDKLNADYKAKCVIYRDVGSENSAVAALCKTFEDRIKEYTEKIDACNAEIETQGKKIFGKKKAQETISVALANIAEYKKGLDAAKRDLNEAHAKQANVRERYMRAQGDVQMSRQACENYLKQRGLV